MHIRLFFILLSFSIYSATGQTLVYPKPSNDFANSSDKYLVSVTQNGFSKKSFVYKTTAGDGVRREWGTEQNNSFHFTSFSFSGQITVEVVKLNCNAKTVTIRPTRFGLKAKLSFASDGSAKISFQIDKPTKLAIEFDDDAQLKDPLVIFADKMENPLDVPDKAKDDVFVVGQADNVRNIPIGKKVVYFTPGVYQLGYWNIPAFIKQVYISGGVFLNGYLNRVGPGAIKINGRGVLSNNGFAYHFPSQAGVEDNDSKKWYSPIFIDGGEGHFIEGITIIESTAFNIRIKANKSAIENVKINGFRFNNDGITISGKDNRINNCFIRANDDAITCYSTNLTIKNCTFWQLQGSVIELGWTPHSFENLTIADCDVIHDKAKNSDGDVGFINAMNFSRAVKPAVIKNVIVDNIYFDTPILRFIDIRSDRNVKFGRLEQSSSMPWVYQDFHFSNIHFSQNMNKQPIFYLHGYDDIHPLTDFTFDNIYFNNSRISLENMNDTTVIHVKRINGFKIR